MKKILIVVSVVVLSLSSCQECNECRECETTINTTTGELTQENCTDYEEFCGTDLELRESSDVHQCK